ncbi:unnamed protein product [Peniophora sp. CBMAI 1063]|nr:unnamed protein product [Peniophora sp. CBMAI 1063]
MSMNPDDNIAWFTLIGCIRPLRRRDLDSTQRDGVALHTTHDEHLIGRGFPGDADVQVRADSRRLLVGTYHAVISWNSATSVATITDRSLNGTWVNGVKLPVDGSTTLTDNAVIWLGPPLHAESCGLSFECALSRNAFLKHFKFESTLGAGGFGDVYQMRRRENPGKVVAVKVARFDSDDEQNAWTENDAMKEVHALLEAHGHPNICPIEDYYVLRPRMSVFVVLPRLSTDLKRHWSSIRPTIAEVQTVLKQLLSAVAHIQSLHMVHRDIKPENIFILTSEPLRVVLADFGLAFKVDLPSEEVPASYLRGGTPWYMAPELMSDATMQFIYKIDLFSIALTIIHLLMGKHCPWNIRYPQGNKRTLTAEREYFSQRGIRWDKVDLVALPADGLEVLLGLSNPVPEQRWDVQTALAWDWVATANDHSGQAMLAQQTVRYVDPLVSDIAPAVVKSKPSRAMPVPAEDVQVMRRRSPRIANKPCSIEKRRSPRIAGLRSSNEKKRCSDGKKKKMEVKEAKKRQARKNLRKARV